MKNLWDRLTCVKGSQWLLLLLALSLVLWAFFPENPSDSSAMTAEENRLARILSSIENAGACQVAIFYQEKSGAYGSTSSSPCGVLIVSQGAHDLTVQLRLMQAAQTLLQLPLDAISVLPMEGI